MGNKIPKPSEPLNLPSQESTPFKRRDSEIPAKKLKISPKSPPSSPPPLEPTEKSLTTRDVSNVKRLFRKYALYSREPSSQTVFTADLPGYKNAMIQRAGCILVTPCRVKSSPLKSLQNFVSDTAHTPGNFHQNSNNSSKCVDNLVVILGTSMKSSWQHQSISKRSASSRLSGVYPSSCWFSGRCEEKDGNFVETIIRETFEESAGLVALTEEHVKSALESQRFFYSPNHRILTIIVVADEGMSKTHRAGYRVPEFNMAVEQLSEQNDYVRHTISGNMLEVEEYHAVRLTDFICLVKRMWTAVKEWDGTVLGGDPYAEAYHVRSVEGKMLRIHQWYAGCLAVPEAEKAFSLILRSFSG